MPTWERFPNAPITEALLDIRVSLPETISLSNLEGMQEAIKKRYPHKKPRSSNTIRVEMKENATEPEVTRTGGPDGFFFTSADQKQIIQARMDGFTFSRLKPYDRWETFRDEAKEIWGYYIKYAVPTTVTRIALRYVNRIEIPFPMRDFKDFVTTTPEIAPALPQGMTEFFMRLVIPEPNRKATVIINQTMEPVESGSKLPFIFDIDVFRVMSFPVSEGEFWGQFEELRDLKNEVFFKSTTAKARELFS